MDNSTGTVRKNDQETNFIGMDLHLDNVVVVVAQNEIKDNTVRSKTVLSKKFKSKLPIEFQPLLKNNGAAR